jgi:glycosyltransferase involved in cell wall biosynthesis
MKILHVLPALTKGGAERVAVDLANAAVSEGHQVSMVLAYPVDPALLQDRLDHRVELRFVRETRSRLGAFVSLLRWLGRNRRWVLRHDIIHCHLSFGSVFGWMVERLRGSRTTPAIVETYHAVGMAMAPWRHKLAAALIRRRDAIALVAEDEIWTRFRETHPASRIVTIPNGVGEPAKPKAAAVVAYRRLIGVPDGARLVGSVGRLFHERRPDALLDSFAKAALRLPSDVHLLLGGEGPERSRLIDRASRLGLADRVHLPGLVRDPAEFFALLDFYLTVNVGETTGIAALEGALSGLPVLAYQMVPEFQPSESDWIWSSRDVDELAARLCDLVRDPEYRRKLGARQQIHARKHHSQASMARAYAALYQTALDTAAKDL